MIRYIKTRIKGGFLLRLNQFRFLLALETHKTFSKAAEQLLIAQPSISQAIKELEDELGYSILLRHKKGGVEFTPQGLWVLEKAHIIIGTLDDLENSKTLFSQRSSVVKIAAPPFWGQILLQIILELKTTRPTLSIQLLHADSNTIIDQCLDQTIDMGLIQVSPTDSLLIKKLAQSRLQFTLLYEDAMCILLRKEHPLFKLEAPRLEDILKYPYVTGKTHLAQSTLALFKANQYHQEIVHISDFEALKAYLAQSDSITLCPYSIAHTTISNFSEQLAVITIADYQWPVKLGIVSQKDTHDLQVFMEALIKHYQSLLKKI